MATHASRNTITGLNFEQMISMAKDGAVDLTKHKLYAFLKEKGLDWTQAISRQLLPDEAYYNPNKKTLDIFEKKFQQTKGSADEKIQTCGFKILEYRKLAKLFGVEPKNVTYTYILSSWFKDPIYKDVLEYIKSIDGCDYIIVEDTNAA